MLIKKAKQYDINILSFDFFAYVCFFKTKKVFESIKNFFRKRELRLSISSNERWAKSVSIADAKTIGIVYIVDNEETYKRMEMWIKSLSAQGKTVLVVGYHPQDIVPHYCIPKIKHEFYSKKDMNWFGKPIRTSLNNFLNEEFDMLIDFDTENIFSAKYIVSKSKAKMKIGSNDDYQDLYDFMILLSDDHSMNDYIHFIESYTNKFKTK